jgi:hypothetical protein
VRGQRLCPSKETQVPSGSLFFTEGWHRDDRLTASNVALPQRASCALAGQRQGRTHWRSQRGKLRLRGHFPPDFCNIIDPKQKRRCRSQTLGLEDGRYKVSDKNHQIGQSCHTYFCEDVALD